MDKEIELLLQNKQLGDIEHLPQIYPNNYEKEEGKWLLAMDSDNGWSVEGEEVASVTL
ncbi:hypothetical protein QJS10_CPB18g00785 [Acorus calamus]|uniref:Uncharacterized protein n=1 Tax=Acorus calamus TaxID=4465 RepID=A0AAV9CJD0_ACOCL|nr:hypothetical protein QJS10_CPB18g00785 [Acorus calamus]